MSSRLVTVSMSSAARGLGWQGGGGCSPWVRRGAGSSLACAGRVAIPIANKETHPMTAAADLVITSFDGRCVISSPFETVVVVRRTAIASALHQPAEFGLVGWNAPPPTTATLACDQRRCCHTLARVKVIDLNVCVSAKRPGTRGFCVRASPRAPAGGTRRVSWWRQPRSALRGPWCELRAGDLFKRLPFARVPAHCSQPESDTC